jgi:hypothetical protein
MTDVNQEMNISTGLSGYDVGVILAGVNINKGVFGTIIVNASATFDSPAFQPLSPLILSNTNQLNSLPSMLDGMLLIGGTGAAPAVANLSIGPTAGVTVVNGRGSITLDTAQDIRPIATPTFDNLLLTNVVNNETDTNLLTLNGDTVGYRTLSSLNIPIQSDGLFTSTWNTVSGFTLGPINNSIIIYNRVGNTVMCSCRFDDPNPSVGNNSATVTLPIARATNFAFDYQCTGTLAIADGRVGSGYFLANLGTNNTATIIVNGVTATGPVSLVGSFMYSLI